ncbi:MAG TPA: hypothetical protein VEB40_00235, partial [Flavipsychrobacter sp.]|nr:hypothetical protein [Flavipsychrobacter sp.]
MLKTISLIALFFAATHTLSAQELTWVKHMGGIYDDVDYAVAVSNTGSVYSTGMFYGNVDLDPGPGVYLLNIGGTFIQKLDADGSFNWARQINAEGYAIAIDAGQNIYITGKYAGTVDFDPGPGVHNLSSLDAGFDIFVLKLDSAANFIWVRGFEGTDYSFWDMGTYVTPDNLGSVYVCGGFKDTVDFDPGLGIHSEVSGPSMSTFLLKLDTGGNFTSVKQFPSNYLPWTRIQMAFGNIGEMYLSGVNNTNTYKLDSLSNIIWTKSLSGGVYGMVKNIDGSTYFTGAFQGAFDFDPSSAVYYLSSTGTEADIFVVKLDSQDNFEWAKKVGGGGYDCGINVNTDANGDVYVTGNFKSTVDFDPGPDSYIMTSFGEEDMFVLKLNKQGGFMSAKQFGSPRREYTSNATINSNGELFVVGYFEDTCDFDPGGQVYDIASNGDNDAFVLKLSSTLELKTLGTQCGPLTIFPNPTH